MTPAPVPLRRPAALLGLFLSGASCLWSACAEAPFSVHAADNDVATLRQALAAMGTAKPGPKSGRPSVFVFAGPEPRLGKDPKDAKDAAPRTEEHTLIGYDLTEGRQTFAVPAEVRSRLAVGRGVVVHREGESAFVVRDAQTGRVRAQVPFDKGQILLGLCADDERFYYVVQLPEKGQRRSQIVATTFDGQRAWAALAPGSAGAPDVQGGVLAVPFRYQDVVLLDGKTGAELSRIRQKDEQIGFVRATPSGLFYGVGDRGVALLDERSVRGQKAEIGYLAPNLGTKVRVFLHWDGYRSEQADFSAFDRNRLLWSAERKSDGTGVGLIDDLAVLHSYRFLFAVGGGDGHIRWAYAQPRQNLMATALTGAAVVYAAQDGELGGLDAKTGARVMTGRLTLRPGQQVLGATFDASGFAPTAAEAKAPEVLEVLHNIIFDKDSSFLAVKTFAVGALNSLPGKEATEELLRVVTAEAMPGQVTRAAGDALVARKDRDVATMLVAQLERRYDFLDNRQPRGVGTLARAAAAMGAREAIPALSRQLTEPTTAPAVLKDLVGALVQLGDREAVRPLRELLMLYRSDPLFVQDAEPLKLAGAGLIKLGGEAGRRTVMYVALEPRTIPPIASYFQKLLDDTAVKPTTKAKAADESPEATPTGR